MDHSNDVTRLYAECCEEVAADLKIPCINIFDAFGGVSPARQEYLCDGLHFNEKGDNRLFQCIKNTLETHLSQWDAAVIPSQYPSTQQLDHKNPSANFR